MGGAREPVEAPRWTELFSGGYARTTVGLVLLETLVAVHILVTVAVLPAVVRDLGGIRLYGVALAAPALATAVALPVTPGLLRSGACAGCSWEVSRCTQRERWS